MTTAEEATGWATNRAGCAVGDTAYLIRHVSGPRRNPIVRDVLETEPLGEELNGITYRGTTSRDVCRVRVVEVCGGNMAKWADERAAERMA